jgi:ATP-dependent RNA helicase SUPV3L1/SUV3
MRRYGIRFGAYHVFMPALLKPAPAELITLLWALKNDGLDKPGYGDLIPALAAGRTSVVADPSFERTFYKLAGFRFLGKRAVRVDILERLADLIRPLLQWKPGATPRPEGAYDGRRFTTTTAMLSILGATPDDMEEILKGLGYRADSVTAEEAQAYLASQTPAAAASAASDEISAVEISAEASAVEETADAGTAEAPSETVTETAAEPVVEAAAVELSAEVEGAKPAEAEEPKPVLLWRPGGGRENNQRGGRPQGDRRGHGGDRGGDRGGQRNAGGENAPQGRRDGDRRDNRRGGEQDKREGQGRDRNNDRRGDKRPQGDRPFRGERNEGGPRPERGGQKNNQPARFEAKPPRKEKPIDPDSPFAKLAALKEQMKK